ncbi:hypothetical protein FACS189465_2670 [Clostridia bacterium]|nr:hypothetical protein FACS189465_2670 [Clostridia bacterium]
MQNKKINQLKKAIADEIYEENKVEIQKEENSEEEKAQTKLIAELPEELPAELSTAPLEEPSAELPAELPEELPASATQKQDSQDSIEYIRETIRKENTIPRCTVPNLRLIPNKKPKNKSTTEKQVYGSFKNVLLTDGEYEQLKLDFPDDYHGRIDLISDKINTYHYDNIKSHFKSIHAEWMLDAWKQKQEKEKRGENHKRFGGNSRRNNYALEEKPSYDLDAYDKNCIGAPTYDGKPNYDLEAYENYSIFDDPNSEWYISRGPIVEPNSALNSEVSKHCEPIIEPAAYA